MITLHQCPWVASQRGTINVRFNVPSTDNVGKHTKTTHYGNRTKGHYRNYSSHLGSELNRPRGNGSHGDRADLNGGAGAGFGRQRASEWSNDLPEHRNPGYLNNWWVVVLTSTTSVGSATAVVGFGWSLISVVNRYPRTSSPLSLDNILLYKVNT